jgi:hypothetical protein
VLRRAVQTTRGRLVLLVAMVAVVMLSTAALLHYVFDQFDDYGEAMWSAGVHLVDPGALVEDQDASERAMGMFQAIAGLVLLIGLLFELVSQTVGRSIERLGRYDPPVRAKDHLLIVGGGEMLAEAAGALSLAGEVGRRHGRVVVVAPEEERQSRNRLLTELRKEAGPVKLDLVFGEIGEDSAFELGAAGEAATILILPSSSGPVIAEAADAEVMATGQALREYLERRNAQPEVRLLFRRGRNVDAALGLFPSAWDPVVGDRTVAGIVRRTITGLEGVPEIEELVDAHGNPDKSLMRAAWGRAEAEGRRLRLTLVGCGIDTPALLEDLAQAGAERFEVTMLAAKEPFEAYLGRADRAGIDLRYEEVRSNDPERLGEQLTRSRPDVVVVTPSPLTWDLRNSDAQATMTLLHTLGALPATTPVVAELFLPETVERLPADPRLIAVSNIESVAAALALTVFNPERARALERNLGIGDSGGGDSAAG